MKKVNLILILIAAAFLASCSSTSITSDYDPSADFSKYKTYKWLTPRKVNRNDALQSHALVRKRIMTATEEVLASKGYKKIESGEPDFFVVTHAGVKEKVNVTDWGYSYGGWYGPYGGYGARNIDVNYYNEATLFLDIVDNEKDELVWRGAGTGVVRSYNSPEERQERTLELIQDILENFPPGK